MRLRVLQVRAGREGPTRLVPGEDGAVNLVVRLHGGEVAEETLVEVGAPGIARPRAGLSVTGRRRRASHRRRAWQILLYAQIGALDARVREQSAS